MPWKSAKQLKGSNMKIIGMNHFTVLSNDVDLSVSFYQKVLGLEPGYRPNLSFPGAWLYIEKNAVLHIIGAQNTEKLSAGVIDHIAFSGVGLSQFIRHLNDLNIPFEHRQQIGSNIWQVFFYDPSGAKVEVDFEPSETTSSGEN
jgi:catechol 2,3-dioxygenase-like lactoylglutathione lyase family enzyme